MFDRETRRTRYLALEDRAKRLTERESEAGKVILTRFYETFKFFLWCISKNGDLELKGAEAVAKAEKDFWQMIEDEKRRRDPQVGTVAHT